MKPKKLKYFQLILGCQMNKSDAERVASFLESLGFVRTLDEKEANLICAQACSVRQSAVDRIQSRIKRWQAEQKRRSKSHFLITALTGCVLPTDRKVFEKQFDLVCETEELMAKLGKMLQNSTRPMVGALNKVNCVLNQAQTVQELSLRGAKRRSNPLFKPKRDCFASLAMTKNEFFSDSLVEENIDFFSFAPKYSSRFQAYIPIQTGCNNFCTYCAVPYTKGREQYRPHKKIVQEIENLVKNGYKEITLLGQNVNSYFDQVESEKLKVKSTSKKLKVRSQIDFSALLYLINDITGNFWIRFISSNPWDLTDDIIRTVADCQKVCEHIHLPLQSGSDQILKKMNRQYSQKDYLTLVDKIRAQISNVAISTDIIVGFPGETKKDFLETVKVMKKVKFDMAYIARFSPRPGTVAARFMKDDVSNGEKKRREKYLERILRQTAIERNQEYVGKEVEVLADTIQNSKLKILLGKTRTFKTVKIMSDKDLTGKIIKVRITKAQEFGLEGELV